MPSHSGLRLVCWTIAFRLLLLCLPRHRPASTPEKWQRESETERGDSDAGSCLICMHTNTMQTGFRVTERFRRVQCTRRRKIWHGDCEGGFKKGRRRCATKLHFVCHGEGSDANLNLLRLIKNQKNVYLRNRGASGGTQTMSYAVDWSSKDHHCTTC